MSTIRIGSWNVLAAPWAAAGFYPDGMDAALLDRTARADLVAAHLLDLDADVWCLQEVTPVELARMLGGELGRRYDHHHVGNGRELWANWSTPAVPWEPNGTAVLWRHGECAADHRGSQLLSNDGDVATWVALTHRHGAALRVMSVHLDADDMTRRRAQLPLALGAFAPAAGTTDVIAGDCNEDLRTGDLADAVTQAGFVDALTEVGRFEPTHPVARPGDAWEALARIDHLLVRGAAPNGGRVVDPGSWGMAIPADRMAHVLATTGSDHLAVVAELDLAG